MDFFIALIQWHPPLQISKSKRPQNRSRRPISQKLRSLARSTEKMHGGLHSAALI